MAYLSEFLGKTINDIDGKSVGRLKDIIAREWEKFPHPVVQAIAVQDREETYLIPYDALATFIPAVIPLKTHLHDIQMYIPGDDDIYLAVDVLDRQIIDTNGARVVRVNDVELVRVNGNFLVSNIDIGSLGIFRRIGLENVASRVLRSLKKEPPKTQIAWDDVELLRHDQSMRLRIPVEKLADLHPSDIAEILSDLNKSDRGQFLEKLDIERMADTLEEVEPEFQAELLENMPDEKIADVLEEMAPDEAADLLAEFSKERSEDLLNLMEGDEAEEVRSLLLFAEDSAGGIMNTEYVTIFPDMTAEQAIQHLRKTANEAETIFYVFVTDAEEHLLGVVSLKGLILASPDALVSSFMTTRCITVAPDDKQDEVAQLIAKYDLLAIPVVDQDNQLLGIVTSDDALDQIIPTHWKKRLPRFYR